MKICNTCLVEKPISEFGPHHTAADGYNPKCKSCVSAYNREYRKRNREQFKAVQQKYRETHKEQAKQRTAQWIADNPERKQALDKQYYQQNRERELSNSKKRHQKNREANCERSKKWREDNPARVAANIAKRRANEKQATPGWANMTIIQSLYEEARSITETSGVAHQVDHIVPLNSEVVCGLHCEANLRIIPADENNAKNNKLIEELL
jgi:hypothetical protein